MKGAKAIAIIDWFAVFLALFSVLLAVQWFVPALVILAIFSSIFAWYYHTYLDVPRSEQEKLVLSNWWAWLEQKWHENPPLIQRAEYYLLHAPMNPAVAAAFLAFCGLIVLVFAAFWLGLLT